MKFNNREENKEILSTNISDEEKKNAIANLKNCRTDAMRIIEVDEELDLKIGEIWNNKGKAESWTDINDDNAGSAFIPETKGKITYLLEVKNVEGYKLQYFSYDKLFETFYYDENMEEDAADELAHKLSNDEVYVKLMELLGSDGDMENEREILVPSETKMRIVETSDERDETGYIHVSLEIVE